MVELSKLLLLPELAPRHGSGHAVRLMRYYHQYFPHAYFIVNNEQEKRVLLRIAGKDNAPQIMYRDECVHADNLLIIDKPVVTKKMHTLYRKYASIIIGLDSRGSGAHYLDYIIDMLPRVSGMNGNRMEPAFLPIMTTPHVAHDVHRTRCLIYFNGIKRAQFINKAYQFAIDNLDFSPENIFVVKIAEDENINVDAHGLYIPYKLPEFFPQCKAIITTFGLSALEARHQGVNVYLMNISRYHARIAHKASFIPCIEKIGTRMVTIYKDADVCVSTQKQVYMPSIKSAITHVAQSHPLRCPNCRYVYFKARYRSTYRTLVYCLRCGLSYYKLHCSQPVDYTGDYFSKLYAQHYGKKYLDDYDAIFQMSMRRAHILCRLIKCSMPVTLLDVGCAYGPFMDAARKKNIQVYGIDLDDNAVQYVNNKLCLPSVNADILNFDAFASFKKSRFNIITMWYVIEHFYVLHAVLKKINTLLPTGGIFALSTPNPRSIIDHCYKAYSISSSPPEHYTLLQKKILKKILLYWGFKTVSLINHGHHCEYYPKIAPPIARICSNIFGLGTTYSLYARKFTDV